MIIQILPENFRGMTVRDGILTIEFEGHTKLVLSNGDNYWVQEKPVGMLGLCADVAFTSKQAKFLQGGNCVDVKQVDRV